MQALGQGLVCEWCASRLLLLCYFVLVAGHLTMPVSFKRWGQNQLGDLSQEDLEGNVTAFNEILSKNLPEESKRIFPTVCLVPPGATPMSALDTLSAVDIDSLPLYEVYRTLNAQLSKAGSKMVRGVKLTGFGPIFTFSAPNATSRSTDYIVLMFKAERDIRQKFKGMRYHKREKHIRLLVGDEAKRSAFDEGTKIPLAIDGENTAVVTHLSLRFQSYKRASFYCDKRYAENGLGCLEYCMIKLARADPENRCAPYLGCSSARAGLPFCEQHPRKQCLRTFRQCQSYCAECRVCKPCEEIRGQITRDRRSVHKLNKTEPDDDSVLHTMVIKIEGQQDISLLETLPFYDSAGFVGQIGGVLGLCFGVSILSLLHLMYYCVTCVPEVCKGSCGGGSKVKKVTGNSELEAGKERHDADWK